MMLDQSDMLGLSGLGGILGGLFGNSGAPYQAAGDQLNQWANKAGDIQNPFYQAGTNAIPAYQNWLSSMQDPSGFINNLMGQYQQSPYAKYLQQQSQRAGINAASASGLIGSTPFAEQLQQNAANISSQDMNQWLQNVLGINTMYGQGQGNLLNMGANSANSLTNLYGNYGEDMAQTAYNKSRGDQTDFGNLIGGALSLGAAFL